MEPSLPPNWSGGDDAEGDAGLAEAATVVVASMAPRKPPVYVVRRLACRQNAVRAVRFSADGHYCMTAGGDKSVKLWNPVSGRLLKTYIGHGGEATDVRSSHDNAALASAGADKLVLLWDVATGQCVRRFRRHVARVNAVLFGVPLNCEAASPSSLLVSVGVDGMLLVWDIRGRTPYPVQTMHEAKDSVNCVAIHKWKIVTGSVDKCVRVYDVRKGELVEDFVGHPVTSVSVSLDGQCALVGCQDSVIRLFDLLTGDLLNKYITHTSKVYRVDTGLLNHDVHVVSGSEAGSCVFVWDLLRGGSSGGGGFGRAPIDGQSGGAGSGEPFCRLEHGPGSEAFSASLPNSAPPITGLAARVALAGGSGVGSGMMVHSLSPHPRRSRLLTAGSDYVWMWDAEREID